MAGESEITGVTFANPHDWMCGDAMEIIKNGQTILLSCTRPKGHSGKHECKRVLDLEEGSVVTSVSAVSRWE